MRTKVIGIPEAAATARWYSSALTPPTTPVLNSGPAWVSAASRSDSPGLSAFDSVRIARWTNSAGTRLSSASGPPRTSATSSRLRDT
ncbi:hypothetical protein G443_001249 [Actinoalloteichus cyanogriseus DSM 43889]|uniref:Uncharacterized protein n=1 Tax=Actinoalloteichus caeruleus DSM 43889 TaxID=1120930 RepID=A0ABT1JFB4_ACTCY|nr:hypothetical protein [Actinoalloteichus caeruleus DSM 43889]